jgi:hypothetical protein
MGGTLGIAILATVFTSYGSYGSPRAFVAGMLPAMWVGVAVLAGPALIAAAFPFSTTASASAHAAAEADSLPTTSTVVAVGT